MPDLSTSPLIAQHASTSAQKSASSARRFAPLTAMARETGSRPRGAYSTALLAASGVADWLLVVATAVGGYYLGKITPNKRPFQLENPDISFPYTVKETVPSRHLVIATIVVPVVAILLFSLLFVPGLAVPSGTPRSIIWRRKLWETHASLLAFAVGMASQWFIVNGLKNLCGKPRPDLLARCQPDLENISRFVVGGVAGLTSNGQLVSATICTNTDTSTLNDGFRSYPSGHSSSSAAGLGHLALFLAYKFGVVFPYASPTPSLEARVLSAFPSRLPAVASRNEDYELADVDYSERPDQPLRSSKIDSTGTGMHPAAASKLQTVFSARRSGAAPPLYLLVIAVAPFCGSVFIAASRWFDYRHHGFDILFGYFIGIVTTFVSFRLYHLPLSRGAGWSWGPRSADKAFWAGVGSSSWAIPWAASVGDDEEGYGGTNLHGDGINRVYPQRQLTLQRGEAGPLGASSAIDV